MEKRYASNFSVAERDKKETIELVVTFDDDELQMGGKKFVLGFLRVS